MLIAHIDIHEEVAHDEGDNLASIEEVVETRAADASDDGAALIGKAVDINVLDLFLDDKGENNLVVKVARLNKIPQPGILFHILTVVAKDIDIVESHAYFLIHLIMEYGNRIFLFCNSIQRKQNEQYYGQNTLNGCKSNKKNQIFFRNWDFFCNFAAQIIINVHVHAHEKEIFTVNCSIPIVSRNDGKGWYIRSR